MTSKIILFKRFDLSKSCDSMEQITGKNILVTGGTGSFGKHIVKKLLPMKPASITIFSRDEEKQHLMENEFEEHSDVLKFVIGDVRDYDRILDITRNVDVIYHAAAIKQVPRCEYHPMEAIKTNVIGAYNVKSAAIKNGVGRVIAISTDKAVKPVNVMGMTKAIQERLMISDRSDKGNTKLTCVRYGNVLGSRGSIVPLLKKKIEEGKDLPITHPDMTRFLISLDDGVDLVLKATEADDGNIVVKKAPSCRIEDLAKVMKENLDKENRCQIKYIGPRPGEKLHEVLVSEDEMNRMEETEEYYTIFPESKENEPKTLKEYTSENTEKLTPEKIKELLQRHGWLE
jgi:UDP-N-acetylglucosamine 4,6-dehydratase/5-epimerase